MKENICVTTRPTIMLLHLAPSSIFEYFCKLQVNEQRRLNKTVSTTICTDNKTHIRKDNSLVALNAKKIFFKSCRKFRMYFLLSENQFFCRYTFIITHFHYNLLMEWWFIKLHSYIMSTKAKPFHLIQIFPLLQFPHVTFCPTLP